MKMSRLLSIFTEKNKEEHFSFFLDSEPLGEVALFLCLCISESLQQRGLLSILRDGGGNIPSWFQSSGCVFLQPHVVLRPFPALCHAVLSTVRPLSCQLIYTCHQLIVTIPIAQRGKLRVGEGKQYVRGNMFCRDRI